MHISLSEIGMILLVALLVIKPERMPETVRTAGRWVKWLRNATAKIKREIEAPLEQVVSDKPTSQPRHDE